MQHSNRWTVAFSLFLMVVSAAAPALAQKAQQPVYLFSYFKNNGEDGLHLAFSKDGYQWTALHGDSAVLQPLVGKDRLMRDPCIIRGANGLFHMVWTVSWKEKTIGYASSADLLHWSAQQEIPVMAGEDSARNCWAPEITYNRCKKQYLIYWATTIPGRFPATDSSGDYNHRIYYVTTRNFQSYSPARLLYNQGFNVIDATIQPYNKGYVMFLKDETRRPPQKNIRVAFSKRADGGFSAPSAPITGNYWAEGPTAVKIGKEWMVYFDKYTQHQYGAVRSADLQHWTDVSGQVHFPQGTRHGTVFTLSPAEFSRFFPYIR